MLHYASGTVELDPVLLHLEADDKLLERISKQLKSDFSRRLRHIIGLAGGEKSSWNSRPRQDGRPGQDISHVLLALAQGLAVQEGGRRLGKSKASANRRWEVGVTGILRGFAR